MSLNGGLCVHQQYSSSSRKVVLHASRTYVDQGRPCTGVKLAGPHVCKGGGVEWCSSRFVDCCCLTLHTNDV